jgi:hypothetical protein
VTLSLVGKPVENRTTVVSIGGNSETFDATETLTLTVTSSQPQLLVNLSAANVPEGVWMHFVPDVVTAGPNGATAELVLAGAVLPSGSPPDNSTVEIHAAFGGSSLDMPLIIVKNIPFSVLQSPSSTVDFETVITNPSNLIAEVTGAVYDPGTGSNTSTPLDVSFSAIGIEVNGTTVPLPQGLQVNPSQTPLQLKPDQSAYFFIGIVTKDVPVGTYDVVVDESIGRQHLSSILPVVVIGYQVSGPVG